MELPLSERGKNMTRWGIGGKIKNSNSVLI